MNKLICAAVSILIWVNLSADWQITYGGTGSEHAHSIQQTDDGGFIITGYTSSFGAGDADIYLIKTDSAGDTLWTKTYGGSSTEWGYSVGQTTDGGYIITGTTDSYGAGANDLYLIKTDGFGDTVWTRTYGGSDIDKGFFVQQTDDGGYVICGSTQSYGAGYEDVYIIKTDSLGDTLWSKTYGGNNIDYGQCIEQTDDGGFIIVGGSYYQFGSNFDVYLIKTDSAGDSTWTCNYGYIGSEQGQFVMQTDDQGYIITGLTNSYGVGNYDVYLLKTDSLGNIEWINTFGGVETDYGNSVQQTDDGGFIIAGQTSSFGAGSTDAFIIKTNSGGDSVWTKLMGGTNFDRGYSVRQTDDGGFIIAGSTSSYGAGNVDVYLIYFDMQPPQWFDLIYPDNNSGIPVTDPTLIWQSTTDNISHYDIYIDGIKRTSTTDTTWNIDYNLNIGMHRWFVTVIDSFNLSTTTDTFTFEVDTTSPLIPVLLQPVNGIISADTSVGFQWTEVTRILDISTSQFTSPFPERSEISYVLEIDTTSSFAAVYTDTLPDEFDTLILSENFYYWHVKAFDIAGNESPYSEIDSFGVDITAPVIESTTVWTDTTFNGPFNIDVKIYDNLKLNQGYLFYKRNEDPTYIDVILSSSGGNWFSGEIPQVYLNPDTVKYYLYAYDLASPVNESFDPPGAPANYYSFTVSSVGVTEDISTLPKTYAVNFISPSPRKIIFNLAIPELSNVTVNIYDLSGRLVSVPVNSQLSPAYYQIPFHPENQGVYFYSVESEQFNQRGKFIIVE
ncbi:MAG: hypothetical protein APR63_05615 [Desulfuromonas sp. SDB]|nr:MAG: hypothetical protein APR63_05615 [Desulfuromonas sp. SDB]